jgi:tRNA-dihydrouridine synthase 1
MFTTCPEDRPLIVQFCANDPEVFVKSSKLVEDSCDAIDLNLGCPQTIARRGHYGAFLQDEWDLIYRMVKKATECVSVPITCKIRVFEDVDKTVQYAKMLESAGCKILTVHGRTREQKGPNTGLASWKHIAAVRQAVSIPVFANGNIQYLKDVMYCLEETGVEAIMTAEGSLHNPAIFTGQQPFCWEMSERYLELVDQYPAQLSAVRGHLFKIWHHVLQRPENHQRRKEIGCARSLDQLKEASQLLAKEVKALLSEKELHQDFTLDNIPYWRCQPYVRPS